LRLLRSWPAEVPDGRAHVIDGMERLVIKGFRYDPWLNQINDDVLLIEWDIAVSREGLVAFADRARQYPDRPITAPYRLYQSTRSGRPLSRPVWSPRYADGRGPVATGDPYCELFPLGMTYLPRDAIAGFFEAMTADARLAVEGFTDGAFSGWWWRTTGIETPLFWEVHPIHLHYPMPRIT
jgi:hypothetical protein